MSTRIKAVLAVLGTVIVLGGLASGLGLFGGASDKELIQVALDEAILASKEGRPGGVLDLLSKNFSVNEEQYGTRDIARTIKDLKPNVEIQDPEPKIEGDSATIISPVKLSVSMPPLGTTLSQVTMRFARENGTKWLVFPTKKWRMVQVEMPDNVVEEVKSQFSGGMRL